MKKQTDCSLFDHSPKLTASGFRNIRDEVIKFFYNLMSLSTQSSSAFFPPTAYRP